MKLKVQIWDQVDGSWDEAVIQLPADCRDPKLISMAVDANALGFSVEELTRIVETEGDEECDVTEVVAHAETENTLVIESRGNRGRRSVVVVNYLDQD